MRVVTVYSRPGCHLCADALARLKELQSELAFEIKETDIGADDRLHRAYLERIPVIALDGEELCDYFLDEAILRDRLRGAGRPGAALI